MPIQGRRLRFVTSGLLGLLCCVSLALVLIGCGGDSSSSGQSLNQEIFSTTEAYVEQFYPLWFTYYQSQYQKQFGGSLNHLVGPDTISPIYQLVVAINDDTLYANSFVDLTAQPLIVTIPSTPVTYSILTLDPYGNIINNAIPPGIPGTYGLTGPGYTGTLPAGVTPIPMPLNFFALIFRADRYSSTNVDQTTEADTFRRSLMTQPLSDYLINPSGGAAGIIPVSNFAIPFKTAADTLLKDAPITFLKQLQVAVESSNTPPLSSDSLALSNEFNRLFGDGTFSSISTEAAFSSGAQSAHNAIINTYLDNTGPTNWITFTNIGNWGTNYLDRAAIAEYIQFANGHETAAYYQTFKDSTGAALDGSTSNYVLTFPAGQIPQAGRFWSVTAYTPNSIELIPNSANKYLVARYSPGLVTNPDGSISIYMSQELPAGVPEANWLPTRNGPFNIMLRVYGPEGSVKDNTYVPPAIVKIK